MLPSVKPSVVMPSSSWRMCFRLQWSADSPNGSTACCGLSTVMMWRVASSPLSSCGCTTMTQLSHVVSSTVMWLSMRARSPSARSPSTRRCASTPLGPIGPRSRAERCPPPPTPTVLAFSNRRPWSAAVGGTFCPVSSQGVWPYRRSIRSLQVARASVWSRAFRWDCSAGVVPVIDSFRVHALSPQASLAYPVRASSRHRPIRISAPPRDTRGCTLDSAAHVKPEHAAGAARPWLSVEQPTVHTDRPGGRTPSAICPRTPPHAGPQRHTVTQDGTAKKRPG